MTITTTYSVGGTSAATGAMSLYRKVNGATDVCTVTVGYQLSGWRTLDIQVEASVGNPLTIDGVYGGPLTVTSSGIQTITQPAGVSQLTFTRTGADINVNGLGVDDAIPTISGSTTQDTGPGGIPGP